MIIKGKVVKQDYIISNLGRPIVITENEIIIQQVIKRVSLIKYLFMSKKGKVILMIIITVLLLIILFTFWWNYYVGCNIWQRNCVFPSPKLVLTASSQEGKAPLKVNFNVEATGFASGHIAINCPDEQWEFEENIGSMSLSRDCVYPINGDSDERNFTNEHVYKKPGTYQIKFLLNKGGIFKNIIASNEVIIIVQ